MTPGRGAIVIDTASSDNQQQPPAAYFTEGEILRDEDPDINRPVSQYTPDEELVIVAAQERRHTSSYRVRRTP